MKDNFLKGIIKENPVFVSLLSLCPLLAVSTTFEAAFGMGVMILLVLMLTNAIISLVAPIIPKEVRIPAYIVIIASVVTAISLLTQAFLPALAESLGIFIPLIAVNCIVLGRAESFASKNKVLPSVIDAAGMGIGIVLAFAAVGFTREFFGTGGLSFGAVLPLPSVSWTPLSELAIPLFTQAGGAFLTLGVLLAIVTYFQNAKAEKAAILAKEAADKLRAQKAQLAKEAK